MRRILASQLLRIGETVLDKARSEAEVAESLRLGSQGLMAGLVAIEARSPDWAAHARLTLSLLAELTYCDPLKPSKPLIRADVLPEHSVATSWRDGLAGRIPVSRDGVPAGTSAMLASLLESKGVHAGDIVIECIERMLRHVELRREQAFPFAAGIGHDEIWVERHQAAILLARAADILGDLRYLNAALKLNDLAYPAHRRFRQDMRHILFLRALAEQELVLKKVGA